MIRCQNYFCAFFNRFLCTLDRVAIDPFGRCESGAYPPFFGKEEEEKAAKIFMQYYEQEQKVKEMRSGERKRD